MRVKFWGVRAFQIAVLRLLPILSLVAWSAYGFAQTPTGTLRGKVTDPSGALIPKATVTATLSDGAKKSTTSNSQGEYEIQGLPAGTYTVEAAAKGLASAAEPNVTITPGQVQRFDIALGIVVQQEKVDVQDQNTTVDVNPENNASSLIIKGKDLDALSDDPDELQSELQALAGPSAGPNGGEIYIDGFTGGQIPPKSAIREIRINQNPFSAQYDKLGYGRIEIFTKPGSDKYHGQISINGNDSSFNSPNPFLSGEPSYHTEIFDGNLGGPITKKASFFFDGQRRDISDVSAISAIDPSSGLKINQAFANSRTRTNLTPRFDFQFGPSDTLTVRYQFFKDDRTNQGVGQYSLPSQAYDLKDTEHTLQVSHTHIVSPNMVNETRFQYERDLNNQTPLSVQPTVLVLGAFANGGNAEGLITDTQNHYELQNYTSLMHANHYIKFGGRLRAITESNYANSNFQGTFTFPSFAAYRAQTPSQFSIIAGKPLTNISEVDAGLYAEDDWRVRPNITLSYGLRFETQNDVHDHADFAPRVSLAWGIGGGKKTAAKTVLRAGYGIFYDRFSSELVLRAEQLNGLNQQQYIVTNPNFYPLIPAVSSLPSASPTIYQISPSLQAPSIMQGAASLERQLTKSSTLAVTYLNSRGEHQLFLRNSNAPFTPGGPRPNGTENNIYQYDSGGIFRQNQLITNFRWNMGPKLSLFGFYTLSYANSDAGGTGTAPAFLSHQYNPMADYGPASFDVRHRLFVLGSITLRYGFRLNPFVIVQSGQPYTITEGEDVNGDSIFNDRPFFVSPTTCFSRTIQGANVCTPLGTFNTAQTSGQPVGTNSERGPGQVTVNLRLSKSIGLGKKVERGSVGGGGGRGDYGGGGRGGPPGGGLGGRGLSGSGGGNPFGGGGTTNRKYNLTLSVSVRNLFNHVNLAPPIGNVDSPFAGTSTALASGPFNTTSANRRIDLQVLFSF
jgi:hypothetical protein